METLWPFAVVLPIMSSNVRREDGGGCWSLDWYGSSHLQLQDRCIQKLGNLSLKWHDRRITATVCANCYHLSYLMTGSHYQSVGKAAHLNQIYPSFQQNNFIHPVTKLKCYFIGVFTLARQRVILLVLSSMGACQPKS
jgi:hypothetical protein